MLRQKAGISHQLDKIISEWKSTAQNGTGDLVNQFATADCFYHSRTHGTGTIKIKANKKTKKIMKDRGLESVNL